MVSAVDCDSPSKKFASGHHNVARKDTGRYDTRKPRTLHDFRLYSKLFPSLVSVHLFHINAYVLLDCQGLQIRLIVRLIAVRKRYCLLRFLTG